MYSRERVCARMFYWGIPIWDVGDGIGTSKIKIMISGKVSKNGLLLTLRRATRCGGGRQRRVLLKKGSIKINFKAE